MEREDFNGMNLNEDISDEDFNKIVGIYEQIKDKISKEDFISVFNENKELNKDFSFYTDLYCAKRILDNLGPAENEILDEVSGNVLKISDVEVGNENFDIVARVMSISNSRAFVSGKGRDGKLCNLEVADNTGRVRVVLWTQNVKHVKHISEGDIVRIGDIECREGYQGGKEFTLNPRSSIKRLEEGSRDYPNDIDLYPDYYEEFTAISDLRPNEQANIRGRLIRYPTPHKFNSNGRDGRVVSLEIQDESGKIAYTIWNPVPDDLDIEVGDVVKVINEEPRERNGEISFSSFSGRIVRDDSGYEVPEFTDKIYKIQEAIDGEVKDVTLFGKVTKVQSPNEFVRSDDSKGFVRSIELSDETASIRVTLWNNDAKSDINKDDFVKISGGDVELDDFSPTGYRVNTGFNSELEINPDGYEELKGQISDSLDNREIEFYRISAVQDDEIKGVNLFAIVTKAPNASEFTRRDGKKGYVRSIEISDSTGSIRTTLWGDDAKLKIEKGDILKILDGNVEEDQYSPTGYRVNTTQGSEIEINPEGYDEYSNQLRDEIDVSNYSIQKIADAQEELPSSVNFIGIVTKSPKVNEFERSDGKKGYVRSIDLTDDTATIRVTLWGDDAKLKIEKGDILKILDGSLEEDEYSPTGYRVNTGRDCELEVNPDIDEDYVQTLENEARSLEKPVKKIGDIDSEEMDVTLLGIVTKVSDPIEFARNNNENDKGIFKSIELADGTGSIRVTLWGDDVKEKVGKGTILKLAGLNVREDDYADSGYSANTSFNTEFSYETEDIDDELLSTLTRIESQLNPIDIGDLEDTDDEGEEVDIIGRLITLSSIREFERDDGNKGHVCSGDFADGTGKIRVSFWNEKSEYPFEIGRAYKIENARIRLGMYEVELNAGRSARIIEADEVEEASLPSFEELENMVYELKNINELDEDDRSFKVVGRILSLNEIREFERNDGSKGLVRGIEIGDATGIIRVSLWDDIARTPCDVGDPIKIQNPNIRFNDNQVELSVGAASTILDPSSEEMEGIPSYKELEDRAYPLKEIEELNESDNNIRVKGIFTDIYGGRLLTPRCPHCNTTLEEDEEECSYCGNEIDEPNYLLMLPGKIQDDTGEVSVTFFNNLAEELLEMKTDDIVSIYETEGDLGAMEGRVENLEGLTLDVLADVRFSDYDESLRLSPRRIFSKEL